MPVITFSRNFQKKHPREGQATRFVEQLWNSFRDDSFALPKEFTPYVQEYMKHVKSLDYFISLHERGIKYHTIRAGNRFKVGDKFSPRVWGTDINPKNGRSGAYQSKQIIIAPDIEVKKVWDIKMCGNTTWVNGKLFSPRRFSNQMASMASNDGLETQDFWDWFNLKPGKVFTGQIICWNDSINY